MIIGASCGTGPSCPRELASPSLLGAAWVSKYSARGRLTGRTEALEVLFCNPCRAEGIRKWNTTLL